MWRAPSAARLLRDGPWTEDHRDLSRVVLARSASNVLNDEALHEGQPGHCAAGAGSTGLLMQRARSGAG